MFQVLILTFPISTQYFVIWIISSKHTLTVYKFLTRFTFHILTPFAKKRTKTSNQGIQLHYGFVWSYRPILPTSCVILTLKWNMRLCSEFTYGGEFAQDVAASLPWWLQVSVPSSDGFPVITPPSWAGRDCKIGLWRYRSREPPAVTKKYCIGILGVEDLVWRLCTREMRIKLWFQDFLNYQKCQKFWQ